MTENFQTFRAFVASCETKKESRQTRSGAEVGIHGKFGDS